MAMTVYSTPACPFCRQLKNYLREHKVNFTDVDVSANQEKAQEMISKSHQLGVPVADIDGEIVIGFDKKKVAELLKIQE